MHVTVACACPLTRIRGRPIRKVGGGGGGDKKIRAKENNRKNIRAKRRAK